MAYNIKYNFQFSNELDELYYLYFEYKDYPGTPIDINCSVDAFILRSTNGDENKLFPILGTECLINIMVGQTQTKGVITDDSTLSIFDLVAAEDDQIRVTVFKIQPNYNQPVYQGFVVVEDNSQPFLDPPYVLQVRALDGLGQLKNVDMIDADGDLFAGNISVEDWIGNILMKTGLVLNLRTYFPFYPIGISGDGVNPLQQVFLNAQTWLQGEIITSSDPSVDVFASEANDAYTALEKICRCFRSRLFQHDGVWNFVSLYTYVDPNGWSYFESESVLTGGVYNQVPVAVSNGLDLTIPVGKEDIIHPVDADQQLALKLATKWEKLNYTYDQSANKICNQGFLQGAAEPSLDGTISSTIEDPTILPAVTFDYKAYVPFCWTLAGGTDATPLIGSVPYPETAQTADIYTRSVLDITGAEENRYLVITNETLGNHARSTPFLIDVNDNLDVSFDFRTHDDLGNTTVVAMWILMNGDDGNNYGYGGNGVLGPYGWYLLDANYQISAGLPYPPPVYQTYSTGGTNVWTNIEINKDINGSLMKAPVSGSVFIVLAGQIAAPAVGSTAGVEAWFKNIQITILPYLRGSYVQLKGDYNFSSTDLTIKQTMTEDVEISDSPKRYFKGALVQSNGELVVPTWHRKGIIETGRFMQMMERVVYNNLYRQLQKIEGTFRGCTYTLPDFTVKPSGYLNAYTFTQHPVPTKRFILTSFDRNYGTGKGRHVFVEILEDENADPFIDPATDGTYLFQYLYQ